MKKNTYKNLHHGGYVTINTLEAIVNLFFFYAAYQGSYEFWFVIASVIAYNFTLYFHYHSYPNEKRLIKTLEKYYLGLMFLLLIIWIIKNSWPGKIIDTSSNLLMAIEFSFFVIKCREVYLEMKDFADKKEEIKLYNLRRAVENDLIMQKDSSINSNM